jgi:membrane protein YdbS with pleckstrin-like domain
MDYSTLLSPGTWGQQELNFVYAVAAIWSIIWKAISLWYAARNSQKWWYIAIMFVNTLGVLEIVYLVFFQKEKPWIHKIRKQSSQSKSHHEGKE